jgi:hypothetical protein
MGDGRQIVRSIYWCVLQQAHPWIHILVYATAGKSLDTYTGVCYSRHVPGYIYWCVLQQAPPWRHIVLCDDGGGSKEEYNVYW